MSFECTRLPESIEEFELVCLSICDTAYARGYFFGNCDGVNGIYDNAVSVKCFEDLLNYHKGEI